MIFKSINDPRMSTLNVKRGCVVKINGSTKDWHVVKRSDNVLRLKVYDGTPIPSRRSMGGTNAHERKASVRDITHIAVSL